MFFAILALVEEGDEVLLPNPAFPIYESMVDFAGGRPVFVPLRQENGFRFDPDEFRASLSDHTKLVILNSPANPTGGVLTVEDIAGLAEILRGRPDVYVLSDEIYSRLLYADSFASIASEPGLGPDDRTIILDGFSKTYAMTGWRLGYGVMPEPLAEEVAKLQVNSNSCTNAATQHAGLEALSGPQDAVGSMLAEFRARRDLIVAGLNDLPGVDCITPQGAFYAFPRITGTGRPADELADLLLDEAGVACLSGTAFGRHGEGHLRLSYADSRANIARALERMGEVLSQTPAR
jgi:aspartate/methionine/tyrosine aminotransferase